MNIKRLVKAITKRRDSEAVAEAMLIKAINIHKQLYFADPQTAKQLGYDPTPDIRRMN